MGIDPGYATVGFGVIDYTDNKARMLACGAVSTSPERPFPERLGVIFEDITSLLELYKPDAASVEELFFTNNIKTGIQVAQARGVILTACVRQGVSVYEYTPLQVKQSVVGYGKADKRQVMELTRILLHLNSTPKPDDAADALALALCHAHTSGSTLGRY